MKNGGIRGQYIDNSFKDTIGLSNDTVDFTITPKGVDDLLNKKENLGVIFLKFLETHIIMLKYSVFNYKHLSKTINDCTKYINTYNDDTIEELNIAIATNNKVFERFNKAYKDKGVSLDYPPLGYVRKQMTVSSERETRINTIEGRIHKINTEKNALQEDIKELSSKSIFTRLYYKLTGKEDIKKTIENKIDQKEELELPLQILNDELKYLTSL